jgi:hypothetical protein
MASSAVAIAAIRGITEVASGGAHGVRLTLQREHQTR